jgi:hypothetical protein
MYFTFDSLEIQYQRIEVTNVWGTERAMVSEILVVLSLLVQHRPKKSAKCKDVT